MSTIRAHTLDIALLLLLLVAMTVVLVLSALPEPSTPFSISPSPSAAMVSPSPHPTTASATPTPLPARQPTATPTPFPTSSPRPTHTPPQATPTPQPTPPPGSSPTPLPLVEQGALLPHSALFIRRHNDFSTPSAKGIETLLTQGLVLGDSQITLHIVDPLSGIRIPTPEPGAALSARYGLVEIPLTEKRDKRATHYLEIALRAATDVDVSVEQAPTANYVLVIDTSGSMDGPKLEGAKAAVRALFASMRPTDTLALVDFDARAQVVLPATLVSEITPQTLNRALARLVAGGGTDLNQGLLAGIDEASKGVGRATTSHIFLFSDGNPTDGVTDWLQIRAEIARRAQNTPFRVSTFALGRDANRRELDALAGISGGTYTEVTDPATVGDNLQLELQRRDHLRAQSIRLRIQIDPRLPIRYFYGHDQVEEPVARAALTLGAVEEVSPTPSAPSVVELEGEGIQVFVPDLAAGETYWIVMELTIPSDYDGEEIGTATASYIDTRMHAPRQIALPLMRSASRLKLPADLVVHHALAAWTSETAFYTLDDIAVDDLSTATDRLEGHLALLQTAYGDLRTVWLKENIEAVEQLLRLTTMIRDGSLSRRTQSDAQNLLTYGLTALGRAGAGFSR